MVQRTLPPVRLTVPVPLLGVVLCSLPLVAATFCVVWSLVFDFSASTATQCRVVNYLPSVSAAIGDSTPQRYVWRVCVCLHASPRLLLTLAYSRLHGNVTVAAASRWRYRLLVHCSAICNIVEISSLVGLSYISSRENNEVHEALFVSFMVGGLLYMILTIILFTWQQRQLPPSPTTSRSLQWKRLLFSLNLFTFLVSIYLYFRHTWHCEPGVYTAFAACEYVVVLTNIAFHGTLVWDFNGFSVACVGAALLSGNAPHDVSHCDGQPSQHSDLEERSHDRHNNINSDRKSR